MSRITKSLTFDDQADAALLDWLQSQTRATARPGERPDFSRFVRGLLYAAFQGDAPAPTASPLPDTLLVDIRAVVEAAVEHSLRHAGPAPLPNPTAPADDDDFSALLLD